jgi:hypothetical protein
MCANFLAIVIVCFLDPILASRAGIVIIGMCFGYSYDDKRASKCQSGQGIS